MLIQHLKKIQQCAILLAILITLGGLGGCASKSINLVKQGDVQVQVKNSEHVTVNNVYISQRENEVLIHADVRPVKPIRFFQPGHLSFKLISPDNEQYLSLDVTRYSRDHLDSHRSALKHVSFWIRMPLIIPKGSTLIVSHHQKSMHKKNSRK